MTGPLLSLLQRQLSFHYLKVVSRNHATELYDVKQTPLFKLVTTCLTDLRSFDGLSFSLTWESMLVSSCYKIDTFGDNSNNNNNNNNKSCSIMIYLITFSFHLVLLGLWNKGGRNGRCMKHALMRKLYNFIQKMWRGGHLRDVGVGVRIIIKWIKIYRMWGCVGLVKLVRRWDHWRPLWTLGSIKGPLAPFMNLGFHKVWEISWSAEPSFILFNGNCDQWSYWHSRTDQDECHCLGMKWSCAFPLKQHVTSFDTV